MKRVLLHIPSIFTSSCPEEGTNMSTELQSHSASPPPPPPMDEGYWAALMQGSEAIRGNWTSERTAERWDPIGLTREASALEGTYDRASMQRDWALAESVQEADEVVELEVIGYNRGGLLVAWNSLRGFVPASQLVDFPVDVDETIRQKSTSW